MIRVLLLFLGFAFLWVLFFPGMSKKTRLITIGAIVIAFFVGLFFEKKDDFQSAHLVSAGKVDVCDLEVKHSYRTNYDVHFCLQNRIENITVKRVALTLKANNCQTQPCTDLQTVHKEIPVTLPFDKAVRLRENMQLDKVGNDHDHIQWQLEVTPLVASRR